MSKRLESLNFEVETKNSKLNTITEQSVQANKELKETNNKLETQRSLVNQKENEVKRLSARITENEEITKSNYEKTKKASIEAIRSELKSCSFKIFRFYVDRIDEKRYLKLYGAMLNECIDEKLKDSAYLKALSESDSMVALSKIESMKNEINENSKPIIKKMFENDALIIDEAKKSNSNDALDLKARQTNNYYTYLELLGDEFTDTLNKFIQ